MVLYMNRYRIGCQMLCKQPFQIFKSAGFLLCLLLFRRITDGKRTQTLFNPRFTALHSFHSRYECWISPGRKKSNLPF